MSTTRESPMANSRNRPSLIHFQSERKLAPSNLLNTSDIPDQRPNKAIKIQSRNLVSALGHRDLDKTQPLKKGSDLDFPFEDKFTMFKCPVDNQFSELD